MICPKCSAENSEGSVFCNKCGEKLSVNSEKHDKEYGAENEDDVNIKKIKQENPDIENEVIETKKFLLSGISKKEKKNGAWLLIIIKKVLETHVKNVSFDYYSKKYNTVNKDILAKKIISSACRYSVMTGALFGAGGGIFGVPSAIPATFGEIATLTYYQLKMIYDLSLIYNRTINLEDPEESYKIFLIALGIKTSELFNGAIEIGVKKGGKFAVEKAGKRVVLQQAQEFIRLIGIQITQKAIKNFLAKAIPAIGVALGGSVCAAIDFKSTKFVANNSLSIYRTSALLIELFDCNNVILSEDEKSFDTLIKGCLIIANADDTVDMHKTVLIDHVYQIAPLNNNYRDRIKILDKEFFEPFERIENLEIKKTILFTLELIAASDRKISKKERVILDRVSLHLGIDKKELDEKLEKLTRDLFFI